MAHWRSGPRSRRCGWAQRPPRRTSRCGRRAHSRDRARGGASRVERSAATCRTFSTVQFSKELRDDVAGGDITVTFRLWRRPQVKVGGRYRVGLTEIEVDTVEQLPFARITNADVRRAGEHDRESLRARAAHAGPIADDTLLYRIAFHVVG